MDSTNPVNDSQIANSGYFPEDKIDYSANSFSNRIKRYYTGFLYYLDKVWPWIQRLINFLAYEIIRVLKAIVRIGLQQVGLMKE